jgi:hypothetical protein
MERVYQKEENNEGVENVSKMRDVCVVAGIRML